MPHMQPLTGDTATRSSELLIAALSYAVAGWPVLPLHAPRSDGSCSCEHVECDSIGKHPRTQRGLTDASTDPRRVAEWWRRWPTANVGVCTGELVVLDVDGVA